jgi:hypothetical protein
MGDQARARRVVDPVSKAGYELVFEDTFDGDTLDRTRWLPHYLPQWSSREASAARYRLGGGLLRLVVGADQPPWCPEFDGQTRVSSLQTGADRSSCRGPGSAPLGAGLPAHHPAAGRSRGSVMPPGAARRWMSQPARRAPAW